MWCTAAQGLSRRPLAVVLTGLATLGLASQAAGGSAAPPPDAAAVAAALTGAIAQPGGWEDLQIVVECRGARGARSLEISASGVGIWNRRLQFRLQPAAIGTLLELLQAADFAHFQSRFGEGRALSDERAIESQHRQNAVLVVCAIALRLDGVAKESVQLSKGEQSVELLQLAESLLDACHEAGEAGVGAVDLTDGLRKIETGELDPEVLSITLQRRPERPGGGESAPGFLLQLEARQATHRAWTAADGFGPATTLELAPDEVRVLARVLLAARVEELPRNLFSPEYTDLVVQLLDRRQAVQARRFGGVTAATHGDLQRAFDSLYRELAALSRRVADFGLAVEPGR